MWKKGIGFGVINEGDSFIVKRLFLVKGIRFAVVNLVITVFCC